MIKYAKYKKLLFRNKMKNIIRPKLTASILLILAQSLVAENNTSINKDNKKEPIETKLEERKSIVKLANQTKAVVSMPKETVSKAFENLEYEANIRAGAFSSKNGSQKRSTSYVGGGILSAKTSSYKNFSLGGTFSTVNSLYKTDNENSLILDSNGKSYTILNEAYIIGSFIGNKIKLGRQFLDTPFADKDDYGMIPNSFEAYIFENKNIKDLTITGGFVFAQSGIDAPILEQFTQLNEDKGVYVLGTNYEIEERGVNLQAWSYYAPESRLYLYGDIETELETENFGFSSGFQLVAQNNLVKNDTENGKQNFVFGANVSIKHENSGTALNLGTNIGFGDLTVENGFGGGPFYTSGEVQTINSISEEAKAFLFGIEFSKITDLTLALNYFIFTEESEQFEGSLNEIDFSIEYEAEKFIKNLSFIFAYANYDCKVKNSKTETEKNDQIRFFTNYSF
jgi:hypothetical protein